MLVNFPFVVGQRPNFHINTQSLSIVAPNGGITLITLKSGMKYYTTEDCRTVFLRIKEKALKNVFIDVPSDDEKCGTLLNVDQIEAVHENWNDSRSADIVMGNKTITTPLKVPEVLALIAQVKSEKIDP